jgi:SAM-dependent methyltransferase
MLTSTAEDLETNVIRCPQCGEQPLFESVGESACIARCSCAEMPMAEGVLVTEAGDLQARLLDSLRSRDLRAARSLILGKHGRKARLMSMLGMRPTFERFVRHRALSEAVSRLHINPLLHRLPPRRIMHHIAAAAQWNIYIRHRFVLPSMVSMISLLGLVQGRKGMILDAPCGTGHVAFVLSKLVPQLRLVCMDLSPAFVYSTRRFFAPDASAAMVHNMNNPLPLAEGAFGAVFCADSFQYVENRRELARRFMNLIREDGVVVISHVHNRLQRTKYAGYPLSPAEYAELFQGFPVRIVPSKYLVQQYLDNAPVDLRQPVDEEVLNRSEHLHIIAARSPDVLGVVPPVRDALLNASKNPRLNGLYRMRRRGAQVVFERRLPQGLLEEYAPFPEILPPRVSIPASSVHRENGRLRFDDPRSLLQKHVLVDVPVSY